MHDYRTRHFTALQNPKPGHERAIVELRSAIRAYCTAHERTFEQVVGDDHVLGPEVATLIKSFLVLLNGETGRLDCGTLEGEMRELAKLCNLELED